MAIIKKKQGSARSGKARKSRFLRVDFILLFTSLLLLVLGLTMLFSTTTAINMNSKNVYSSIIKQGGVAVVGLVGMFYLALFADYRKFQKWSLLIYVIVMGAMVLVSFFGVDANGARRQIELPVGSLQPSEFSKYAMILLLAARFAAIKKGQLRTTKEMWINMAIVLIPAGICMVLQRHASGAIVHMAIGFLLMWAAGVDMKKFIPAVLAVGAVAIIIVMLTDFRMERILSYINPSADSQGDNYQAIQAILAVGSGGLFGRGLFKGVQKYSYLPEAENDYIFAIVGEELGFVGSVIIVLLFVILMWRGITTAMNCRETFGTYMAYGITSLLGFQVLVNMCVVLRVLPSTGMQLPLFSMGGSSMLATLIGLGFLMSITRANNRQLEESE